jgi:uncharacterized protein (UPF0335 family)
MSAIVGKNTLAGDELRSIVDRLEYIDAEKKRLGEDRKAILSEAAGRGFIPKIINHIVKLRKKKPHDLQEEETLIDVYKHGMGMDAEPPIFRQIQALARDSAGGEKLVEAFKQLVPTQGDIILNIGGKHTRLWRDKDGNPHAEDYTPPDPLLSPDSRVPARPKPEVPNCTAEEAVLLGAAAAKANVAVIDNPFPFGDERRPKWDEGWRAGSGNDGMGGS